MGLAEQQIAGCRYFLGSAFYQRRRQAVLISTKFATGRRQCQRRETGRGPGLRGQMQLRGNHQVADVDLLAGVALPVISLLDGIDQGLFESPVVEHQDAANIDKGVKCANELAFR